MTYRDEVIADGPQVFLPFTAGSLNSNIGSATSVAIASRTITSSANSLPPYLGVGAITIAATGGSWVSATVDNEKLNTQYNWTVEFWLRKPSATGTQVVFYRAPGSTQAILNPNGTISVQLYDGTTTQSLAPANNLKDGAWHHIVVTNVAGSTDSRLFIDGVQVANLDPGVTPAFAGQAVVFGSQNAGTTTSANVNGDMAGIAIYDKVLTPTRIQQHYDRAFSLPAAVSISTAAPAAIVDLTTPAPVVTAIKSNNTISAPAVTVSLTSPNAVVKTVRSITTSAPAMTVSISAQNATVTTQRIAKLLADLTREYGGALFPYDTLTMGAAYFGSTGAPSIPQGSELTGAVTFSFYSTFTTGTKPAEMYRATDGWQGMGSNGSVVEGTNRLITVVPGWNTVDISDYAAAWGTGVPGGVYLASTVGSNDFTIATGQEGSSPTLTPYFRYAIREIQAVNIVATPGPVAVNIAVPQHRSGTGNTITAGAGSATIDAVAPVVTAKRNMKFSIPAITLTQLFPGGRSVTPDVSAKVDGPVAEYYVSAPNATQYIAVPSINVIPVMELGTVQLSDITLNFNTDRKVKVNNAMSMTTRLVGIYNAEADRYVTLVDQTVDFNDVWLPLDDVSGDVARDLAGGPETNANNPASYYRGDPQLAVDGPYLRKAVHFDGVDDFIQLQYTELFPNKVNFEFSIRTTQQNGTILSGGGSNLPVANLVADNQAQIRLVDGKIALFPGNGTGLPSYVTSAYVADGEWHHVVINIPWMNNTGFYGDAYTYVAVDGKVKWTRYANVIGFFRPLSAMAAVNVDAAGVATPTRAIDGDMSHLIIRDQRELGQSLSTDLATKLYYEWSNATLIQPNAIAVNLSMPAPHRARGNRKRMIVLMGLPNGGFNSPENAFTEAYNYWSIFAGYYIGIEDMPGFQRSGPDINRRLHFAVAPFVLEDYICYPVTLVSEPNGSGSIQLSAEGMEKDGIRDPLTRVLIDDETGLARFINLQTDLNESIEDFDAITALNYPAEEPTWDANTWGGTASRVGDFYEPKQFTRLTATQWKVARDKLRDSILEASYAGVNLWINEPQMAQHLGFIQAYDKHVLGYPGQEPSKANPMAEQALTYAPAAFEQTVFNKRGDVLDAEHVLAGNSYGSGATSGNFFWTWQINSKRIITATEPGLTDLPGAFIKDQIDYQSKDRWQPHSRITAYDVLRRENGLQVGDSFQMPMVLDPNTNTIGFPYTVGNPRRYIVSARPQGVAGKVISKETDFYYGANGIVVTNPFAGNVITIAAERGTVVRGRPIMGRAFIEFMSPETQQEVINVDADKSMWQGDTGRNVSTWDFDSRRYLELVSKQIVNLTSRTIKVDSNGGTSIVEKSGPREVQWYEKQVATLTMLPYISMNARGLYWLGLSESIPAGTVRTFAAPMEITLNAPAPKIVRTGGAVSAVVGPMRVDIDLRQPRNFRGADYAEKSLPMVLNITMVGIGKVVKAGPMELNITAPVNVRGVGSGDRIFVYMDAGTNVTLYIEEK